MASINFCDARCFTSCSTNCSRCNSERRGNHDSNYLLHVLFEKGRTVPNLCVCTWRSIDLWSWYLANQLYVHVAYSMGRNDAYHICSPIQFLGGSATFNAIRSVLRSLLCSTLFSCRRSFHGICLLGFRNSFRYFTLYW